MARRPKSRRPLIKPVKKPLEKQPAEPERWLGGVFQLFGLGKDLSRDEDPDEYVRRLREGWE